MPNRVQTLRSSVPGNAPQAGTRQPGELWLNFVDSALGFIDSAQTAQKLLAVRLFVTTANYAVGDFVVQGGSLYCATAPSAAGAFTASNWTKVGTAQDLAQYMPLAGGTLTGALTLAGDPATNLGAATKQYADAGDAAANANAALRLPLAGGTLTGPLNGTTATFSGVAAAADPPAVDSSSKLVTTAWFASHIPGAQEGSNRLINGDMRIDQRNNGAGGSAGGYTIDRWGFSATQSGKINWGRNVGPASGLAGFPYCLGLASSSAYALLASDFFVAYQPIEADMVSDFAWGTAAAQPVTLSFWAYSNQTGTFGGSVRNYAATRSYPFSFSIPAASTWTRITTTIPGDTAGTWVMSGNGGAVQLNFDLGSGATYRGSAGAWAAGDLRGVTGAVSIVTSATGYLAVTGVKLEIGSVATPFNRQSLAKSLADCQRYFRKSMQQTTPPGTNYGGAAVYVFNGNGTAASASVQFSPPMRASPTATVYSTNGAAGLIGYYTAGAWQPNGTPTSVGAGDSFITVILSGYAGIQFDYTLSAEL